MLPVTPCVTYLKNVYFAQPRCHFASEHFGFDDMMMSRTPWDLTGTNNGRSLVHEKHASKKSTSTCNFQLKFGRRDHWPLKVTKSKKQEKVKISSQ